VTRRRRMMSAADGKVFVALKNGAVQCWK